MTSKQIEKRFDAFKTFAAILLSLILAFVVIALVSEEPVEAIISFAIGPLQRTSRLSEVIVRMTPIVFTGVGVCIMYQANQFNMIAEGAFLIGANIATYFLVSPAVQNIPKIPLQYTAIAIAFLVGLLASFVPAILKVKFNANTVVSSIMMNYILLQLANYILYYQMRDESAGQISSYKIPEQASFESIIPKTRIHTGIIIALVVVIVAYIFIYKTKWGYSIRMVGANESFAKYSGISVMGVAMMTQLIGGGIAGMGGAVEVMGLYDRYLWYGTQPGYGFDGIMVAVLAKNNPLYVPLAAFFLAYLRVGADTMNLYSDVPVEFVSVIQAIVIMLVAAEMFLSKYKHKLIVSNAKKQEAAKEASK